MAQTKNKTTETDASVEAFIAKQPDEATRADCHALVKLMSEVTKQPAKMWGSSIVGFGSYHYVYESGREGDSPLVGFSPRKANLTLYILGGHENYAELFAQLGPYKEGKACVYIKRLADLHQPTLKKLIKASIERVPTQNGQKSETAKTRAAKKS
jgi:Domain of unknown function (DU1801)